MIDILENLVKELVEEGYSIEDISEAVQQYESLENK